MLDKMMYFLKQATKSISGHKAMSFASVCIVTASLVLLGIFSAESMNISQAMGRFEDSREINVYLAQNSGGRSIVDIENDLKSIKNVKKVSFRSREDRLQSVINDVYGEDGYIYSGDENPLRDSYIVTVDSLAVTEEVCTKILDVSGVEEVVRSNDIIAGIDSLTRGVKSIYTWITLIFMLIAIFIISNTVKIGVSARQDEIEIMKSVGATNSFILMPFIFEAFILGIIGAAVAAFLVIAGYSIVVGQAATMISKSILSFVTVFEFTASFLPTSLITGTIIGVAGSVLAVRKYLK